MKRPTYTKVLSVCASSTSDGQACLTLGISPYMLKLMCREVGIETPSARNKRRTMEEARRVCAQHKTTTAAAEAMGCSRQWLYRVCRRHGIQMPSERRLGRGTP